MRIRYAVMKQTRERVLIQETNVWNVLSMQHDEPTNYGIPAFVGFDGEREFYYPRPDPRRVLIQRGA